MARNATPMRPKAQKPAKRAASARLANTTLRDRFDAWRLHHRDSAIDALKRMRQSLVSTVMTVLVIAIALALPAGLSVLLENARSLTQNWDGNVHLSVFLNNDVSEASQRRIAEEWQQREDIDRVEVVTREQALAEYKELSGFGEVLDALPDNPLPPLIIVYPSSSDAEQLTQLKVSLGDQPNVDQAVLDIEWVRRLHAMLAVGERVVSALMLALALAVVLVVVNTIRLAIENRREEIVVVKIVGGTDGFVRRPFLYTGFWFGLFGGLAAVMLVQSTLLWLSGPVNRLSALYSSEFSLSGLGWETLLALPVFAGVLGLMGAWLAVSRHLKDIEPQAF
ncbi:MAG: permease-like cell division protein FtsX [Alcanivoracaceae bacterium]|nr:permease-like cell division protein FtsX [Alcanivoracaceae bacterium]